MDRRYTSQNRTMHAALSEPSGFRSTPTRVTLFGQGVALPFACPQAEPTDKPISTKVVWGAVPDRLPEATVQTACVEVGREHFLIRLPGVASYLIEPQRITVSVTPEHAIPDVRSFMLGPVMAAQAYWRGLLPFWGGCIELNGQALLLCGAPGLEKGNLILQLIQRGYKMLSSDLSLVRLDGNQGLSVPAYPQLKLMPAAISSVHQDPNTYPRVRDGLARRWYPVGQHYVQEPTPLHRIVFLQADAIDVPTIYPVRGPNALRLMMEAMAFFSQMRHHYGEHHFFLRLAMLLNQAPVFVLKAPRGSAVSVALVETLEGGLAL